MYITEVFFQNIDKLWPKSGFSISPNCLALLRAKESEFKDLLEVYSLHWQHEAPWQRTWSIAKRELLDIGVQISESA